MFGYLKPVGYGIAEQTNVTIGSNIAPCVMRYGHIMDFFRVSYLVLIWHSLRACLILL